ncbi:scavenger receptor class B member 1 [Galendromus occidentalis]|uniref:Scavenger receptor class B member 1 n=1 Tax=Galendromus occidentalis TaxID=34638 RepID=A0AAJ6QT18_9ACAR|nr:scavenger receptor class B member 1 [Galendromus occidentalis]
MTSESQKLEPVSGSGQVGEHQNGAGIHAVSKSAERENRENAAEALDNNNDDDAVNGVDNNSSKGTTNNRPLILQDEVTFIGIDPPGAAKDVASAKRDRQDAQGKRRPSSLLRPFGMNLRLIGGVSCVTLGLLLVFVSVGTLLNFNSVFRWILGRRVVLSPKSQGFPIWRDVSKNYDTRVAWYLFNLTNPEEFKQGGKPIVKEVGPFWYKVDISKKNITFHNNKTVSFEEHRFFTFDPVNSVSDEETNITMVNVPLMAALHRGENLGWLARGGFATVIGALEQAQHAVVVYKVKELTYTGQSNSIVQLATLKEGFLTWFYSGENKKGRFGFGVDKNDTNPGVFNMYTGATGVQDLNRIHSMDGQHVREIWSKPECNVIDGTFGNLRPPMNETNSTRVYVPDMCRALVTRYQKDVEWHKLRLRRFNLTIDNFLSSKENPDNVCYDASFKLPSGVAEVGPCKKDAPIVMSLPHFLQADPQFRAAVDGMHPDQSRHEFVMDHEPLTGTTVRVHGRMQANVRVIPSDMINDAASLPEVTLPLFWQEMYVEGGPNIVSFLTKVNGYPGLGKIAMTIVALFGLILAVIGAGLLIASLRAQRSATLPDPKHKVAYSKAATTEPRVDI